ncbi:MAG: hypothetical protein GY827_04820 [Cytophagales bacterium]|nr:hypothetical protein [Cytophagales bacterium]
MDYKEKMSIIEEYKELYAEEITRFKKETKKIFPNAHVEMFVYNGIGDPTLIVNFRLIEDKKDQSHQNVDNDPVYTTFIGHLPVVHPDKDTKFKLERLRGDLSVQPPEDSYLAMGRVKLPYRKSTGNIAKQTDKLIAYFKKVGKAVLDNQDNLYKKDIDNKYLDIND